MTPTMTPQTNTIEVERQGAHSLLRVRLAHDRATTKLIKLEHALDVVKTARREYSAAHAELVELLRLTQRSDAATDLPPLPRLRSDPPNDP